MAERVKQETEIRDHLIERVLSEIPYTRLNVIRQTDFRIMQISVSGL